MVGLLRKLAGIIFQSRHDPDERWDGPRAGAATGSVMDPRQEITTGHENASSVRENEQGDDSVYKRGQASKWTRGRKGDRQNGGDRKRAKPGKEPRIPRERERDYTT